MANVTLLCFLLLAVSLVSVTSVDIDTIDNINELKGKDFGRKYPRHGLALLHWFCHHYISFDNNNNMVPKSDPQHGAYGIHYYGNYEELLPSLTDCQGCAYYTVGNLQDNVKAPEGKLPQYVFRNFYKSKNSNLKNQNNRDRIIMMTYRWDERIYIDEVYITQHYEPGDRSSSDYDPKNTFRIDRNLIKVIHKIFRFSDFWRVVNRHSRKT